MKNLAGVDKDSVSLQCAVELQAAGIPELSIQYPQMEVCSSIVGFIFTEPCYFGFQRAWRYWVVKASKPFPLAKILAFNAEWGDEARISAHGNGLSNEEVERHHLNGDFDQKKWQVRLAQYSNLVYGTFIPPDDTSSTDA